MGPRQGRTTYRLLHADSRIAVRRLKPNSVAACITDPPFEMRRNGRRKVGYLGQQWDRSGIAFDVDFWAAVCRTMKPGAHLVAFGGDKTIHRLMLALEDAGLELRHLGMWVDANRASWSRDPVKAGADPELWEGTGTALKAATPWVLCRKPLERGLALVENLARWGTGALNVAACRHPAALEGADGRWPATMICSDVEVDGPAVGVEVLGPGLTSDYQRRSVGPRKVRRKGMGYNSTAAGNTTSVTGDGSATLDGLLGPYTRFFRIPGCSDTTLATVPEQLLGDHLPSVVACPRSPRSERALGGSNLPNIPAKPVSLMRHLVRLSCPAGGLVLDPFAGTGSTGVAALWEGRSFVGIELNNTKELPLVDAARARLRHARHHPPPDPTHRASRGRG